MEKFHEDESFLRLARRPPRQDFVNGPTAEFYRWYVYGGTPRMEPLTKEEMVKLGFSSIDDHHTAFAADEWNDFKDWRLGALRAPIETLQTIVQMPDTKSGDPRDVPLSPVALAVLKAVPRPITGGKMFAISQDRLIRGFRVACKKGRELYEAKTSKKPPTGWLENLRFHDLRHEAASRWASVLAAQELAKMFGWRTLQMALRYYHPTGESLAEKLARAQQRK